VPFAAFIGTSLYVYAIPSSPPTASLFPDAPTASYSVRVARGARTYQQTTALLKRAVEVGIRKVYVEINPIFEDISFETDAIERLRLRTLRMHDDALEMLTFFNDMAARLHSPTTTALSESEPSSTIAARERTGANDDSLVPVDIENAWMQGSYVADSDPNRHRYKTTLHPPRRPSEISAILALARKKQVDVVFMSMPRSESASRELGSQFERAYAKLLDDFVERFDATVLRPGMHWPDDYFVDRAHVNIRGRMRMMDIIRHHETGRR
jgi:hypothetical protein